jgi:putative endonuclease
MAVARLRDWGWRIRETNWRCRHGEIDIVAQDADCLVIVEVRTRRGQALGSPEESLGARKRARLARLGEAYVQAAAWDGPWRIDVLAVVVGRDGVPERMTHYADAVGEDL